MDRLRAVTLRINGVTLQVGQSNKQFSGGVSQGCSRGRRGGGSGYGSGAEGIADGVEDPEGGR